MTASAHRIIKEGRRMIRDENLHTHDVAEALGITRSTLSNALTASGATITSLRGGHRRMRTSDKKTRFATARAQRSELASIMAAHHASPKPPGEYSYVQMPFVPKENPQPQPDLDIPTPPAAIMPVQCLSPSPKFLRDEIEKSMQEIRKELQTVKGPSAFARATEKLRGIFGSDGSSVIVVVVLAMIIAPLFFAAQKYLSF